METSRGVGRGCDVDIQRRRVAAAAADLPRRRGARPRYSPTLKYAAVAGDTGIKLVEMTHFKDLKREAVSPDVTDGRVAKLEWSPDGHILTAASTAGRVHAFLARMPIVHGCHGTRVAYLSSLREITVTDRGRPESSEGPVVFPVGLEPAFLAVGPDHVAVGMNNVVMFYRVGGDARECPKVNEQEYGPRAGHVSEGIDARGRGRGYFVETNLRDDADADRPWRRAWRRRGRDVWRRRGRDVLMPRRRGAATPRLRRG